MLPPFRSRKVNDLHTAQLALEIATDLAASHIVNDHLDRNQVDLNRLSQVRNKAPWFLDTIERLLQRILAKHERAEILVIHGWNVTQAKCDFGFGSRLGDDGEVAELGADTNTVSREYLRHRLQPLRASLRHSGIDSALGERYPARHPNNLLQLFRRGGEDDIAVAPRLREWATSGRIEAVQWELGIPLRWPGPQRERLRAVVRQCFSAAPATNATATAPRRPDTTSLEPPATLRFFDANAGLGMLAALDPAPPPGRGAHGRVLLFLDRGHIALFTGDARGRTTFFSHEGPRFESAADGAFRFLFRGSALTTDDGLHYLDLEQALSRSQLCRLDAQLDFTADGGGSGRVRGTVELDGRSWRIATHGFADPRPWRRWSGSRRSEWTVHAVFTNGRSLVAESGPRRLLTSRAAGAGAEAFPLRAVQVALGRDGYTPREVALHYGERGCLRLEPVGRIAVMRPVARGRNVRATLGVAHAVATDVGEAGTALFEYARLYDGD